MFASCCTSGASMENICWERIIYNSNNIKHILLEEIQEPGINIHNKNSAQPSQTM